MELILYFIGIVIVILFLVGVAFLSVRLHTKEEIHQHTGKKVQQLATDDLPGTDNHHHRRGSFNAFRGERTII
jgi:hypothetical protein